MNNTDGIKEAIMGVILELVENSEMVHVTTYFYNVDGEQVLSQRIVFGIVCEDRDKGKIIGREGKTFGALIHLVNCMSAKNKILSHLEICD